MDKSLLNEKRYVLTDLLSDEILLEDKVQASRYWQLNNACYEDGAIVYWMNRDKRVFNNWALLFAQQIAFEQQKPLIVIFKLEADYTRRRYDFLIDGLMEIESELKKLNISFYVFVDESVLDALGQIKAGCVVTDFSPLRASQMQAQQLASELEIPFYQVDAHNICPVMTTSPKQEYAARTIRPKIKRILAQYLTGFPPVKKMPKLYMEIDNDYEEIEKHVQIDASVPATCLKGGFSSAHQVLKDFIDKRLIAYDEKRNDPNVDAQSNLSPYISYGYISAQMVASEVFKSNASKQNKEAFLEELIIRKELSDNLCFYNKEYDTLAPCDNWAKDTLQEHESDIRDYLYSLSEFEQAETHDLLWNAAQLQMVKTGKMHGYMRMYWAKKILEWTPNAQVALDIAIYLNDKYELDGCCPNGYVGVLWSIGGVHDRAWFQRDVFGKIRYMSYGGCKGKFDIEKYVNRFVHNQSS